MNIIRRTILTFALMAGIAPAIAQSPTPVPALPDSERRTSYSISATTCACAVNMALYGDSTDFQNWLEVWLNGVRVNYNDTAFGWTITVPTGSLATRARPISDAVLTFNGPQTGTVQIVGARRPRRVAQFAENTGVPARSLNQALTDIVAMQRETWDKINDVTGRAAQAPGGETMKTLPPLSGRASMNACFDSGGNLTSCVGASSGSFAAGAGITFTGTNPTTISTTFASNPSIAFVATRATAATLNLSAFSVVQTGGYASGGDGGGATFVNVGSARFIDQFFGGGYGSYTVFTGGTGYVNGTYSGVPLTGIGSNCMGRVVVSGGAVTAVTIVAPCVSFSVNDILVTPNSFLGNSGSGFQLKVAGVTTPLGSFTDSVGTHFQYTVGAGNFVNVRQFGAKMDWHLGNDAIATDDTASLQAAFGFASFNDSHSPGNGGFTGQTVIVPAGGTLYCDNAASSTSNVGLFIPQGVWVKGQGVLSTIMHHCTSLVTGNGNVNPITLCDTVTAVGQFGCRVTDMMLEDPQSNGFNGTAVIYANSAQQQTLADNLLIVTKSRGCVKYELGMGGAANDIWHDIDCEMSSTNVNNGFDLNSSGTQHILTNVVFGCPGGCSGSAIINRAGRLIATGIDHEEFATGLTQNVSIAGNISSYKNVQGSTSSHCSSAVALASTNTPGNIVLENVSTSCLATVTNGQTGGSNFTGNIRGALMCVNAGACTAAVP